MAVLIAPPSSCVDWLTLLIFLFPFLISRVPVVKGNGKCINTVSILVIHFAKIGMGYTWPGSSDLQKNPYLGYNLVFLKWTLLNIDI